MILLFHKYLSFLQLVDLKANGHVEGKKTEGEEGEKSSAGQEKSEKDPDREGSKEDCKEVSLAGAG